MDQLAVPQGFPGAMENWGLSIYIEYTMLIDESQSSARDRDTINEVIAHELAHQWFGDLVTNDWWDVIWLNEGFAVYVSYIGMEAIAPEGENFDRFYVNVMEGVMRYDQHPSKTIYCKFVISFLFIFALLITLLSFFSYPSNDPRHSISARHRFWHDYLRQRRICGQNDGTHSDQRCLL